MNFRLHVNLTVCIYVNLTVCIYVNLTVWNLTVWIYAPGAEVAYTYVNPNGFSYYIIDNVIAMATLRGCRNVLL